MVSQWLRGGIWVYAIAIPLWILFRLIVSIVNRQQRLHYKREILTFLFFLYVLSVMISTLMPIPMTHSEVAKPTHFNLVPIVNSIKQYREAMSTGQKELAKNPVENILGNILLFLPLGILLPLMFRKVQRARQVVLVAFLCSLSIETIQFISGFFEISRTVDVDDVICNTLGALIGFILLKIFTESKSRNMVPGRRLGLYNRNIRS